MQTKKIVSIVLAVCILGAAAIAFFAQSNKTGNAVTIGVITPMTGNSAHLGEGIRNAILLAQSESKDTKREYKFIFEDDALDPKKSAVAAQKLTSIDHVDAIISFTAGTGNAVSPIADANKTPHIGLANDRRIATGTYNFVLWTPGSEQARVFVAEVQRRGIKKIALFETKHPGIKIITDAIREQVKNTDVQIVSQEQYVAGTSDFRSIIVKSKDAGAQLLVPISFSPEVETLTKQIRELGITTPLASVSAFELVKDKSIFNGHWYVAERNADTRFIDAYKSAYERGPTLGGVQSYEVTKLIIRTAEQFVEKPSREALGDALAKTTNFDSAIGLIRQAPDGFFETGSIVKMIRNGQAEPLY